MSRNAAVALSVAAIAVFAALVWFTRSENSPTSEAPVARAASPGMEAIPAAQQDSNSNAVPAAAAPANPPVESNIQTRSFIGFDARALTICNRELLKKKGIEELDCEKIDESNVESQRLCRNRLAAVNLRLQEVAAKAAPCPESLAQPSVYYQAIRDLAERGDVGAQRCFIQGYFGINRELGMDLSRAEHDEYVTLAKKFIDERFERGDWSVVRWLSKSTLHMTDLPLAGAYPIGLDNPVNFYKLRRLLMLGNQPGGSTSPKEDPRRLVEFWRKEKKLTPEQFEEAERWAQTMYDQHFNGSQEGASVLHADFCDAR
jgi:hypothetical protein